MKSHEFEIIVRKLGLKVRNSRDRLAWLEYDGQTVVRTKRSHGNKEQPESMIRQQLKLNEQQLAGLIKCNVSFTDYIQILKEKKIIAAKPQNVSPQTEATQESSQGPQQSSKS
jgi:hypothetical protein